MRREHHPFWVERFLARYNQRWTEHFLLPHFDRVGIEPRVQGPSYVHVRGPDIRVGDNLHIFASRDAPVSLSVNPYDGGSGSIEIGDYCVLSPGTRIRSATSVRIGSNCMLAENAFVTDGDWHDIYHRIYPGKVAPVAIGDNVWLGDGAAVFKGVTIGDNSVIGARAVVTRNIPGNAIAAGNPARVIGEIDPSLPMSKREHLFPPGRSYDEFKADYDRGRLAGNNLRGWLKALCFPGQDT